MEGLYGELFQTSQNLCQILCERRGDGQRSSCERMGEAHFCEMEKGAPKIYGISLSFLRVLVEPIAHDWMADGGQMHADLMADPRCNPHGNE